ncbi:MAG TPA: SpoIIE family protein phosphatase [Anaerolineae bacterium]
MSSDADLIHDLNTLNRIAETLNRAVDVRSALSSSLAQLVELMGLETGWVFVVDPAAQDRWAGRGFRLAAYHNLPPAMDATNPAAWDKGCDCQTLCQKGKLNEAYNEVRCSRLASVEGDRKGLSVHASAPLCSGSTVLGILNVAAPDWRSFSERTLALLTNVGSQLGVALERTRLYDLLHERRVYEQAALLELSNQLLARSDLTDLMAYLVEEVQRLLQVDACAVLLVRSEDPNTLRFRAATGWRSDPVANQYCVPADARSGSGQVMRTQQPLILEDLRQDEPAAWVDEWLKAEGFESAAIVPLVADGRSIGSLVINVRQPRRFDESEIRFLQLMANQAALAIEKARLHHEEIKRHRMEEELAVGRQIQVSMLPPGVPVVPGWQFSAVYEPAKQVGGDFYDFFELPGEPGRLGLVIADVSGKGVPAALFMALSRTIIRNNALRGRSPADTLIWANRFIQEDSQTDMFLTAFYAALHTNSGRLTFANAGHNRPLWWRATLGEFEELVASGIVLGVLDDVELEERESEIAPGDVLIFYTDGVTESMNRSYEEFGVARLKAVVSDALEPKPNPAAQAVLNAVLDAVKSFTGDALQYDDFTLFVVCRSPVEA